MSTTAKTKSAAVRERLTHPVIDADGHTVEYLPLVLEYLREVGGRELLERYVARMPGANRNADGGPERVGGAQGWFGLTPRQRRDMRVTRMPFGSLPTGKTIDRACVMLPDLFRERIDELGIDFAVVYTTMGLFFLRESSDPELRIAGCRALNKMYADLYFPHSDRMTPVALIPTGTPQEAIAELEHAVVDLGYKAVVVGAGIRRPIEYVERISPQAAPFATWIDLLALGSDYDYDPFWKRCVELKVAVTCHNTSVGFGYRTSPENFVYNHVGSFAAANEAFCKAVLLGGVPERFPSLTFAFLEGGVAWACNLYNDIIEHWETRNMSTMTAFNDPAKLDRTELGGFFERYGRGKFKLEGNPSPTLPVSLIHEDWNDPAALDDWKALNIDKPAKFAKLFERFFFGCEAEDRMTAVAFNPRLNHYGAKMQAVFSSDIGHFDVRDISRVVADAHELVEDGLMSSDDFRDFTFTNVTRLYGTLNPAFFQGTAVEDETKATLTVERL